MIPQEKRKELVWKFTNEIYHNIRGKDIDDVNSAYKKVTGKTKTEFVKYART